MENLTDNGEARHVSIVIWKRFLLIEIGISNYCIDLVLELFKFQSELITCGHGSNNIDMIVSKKLLFKFLAHQVMNFIISPYYIINNLLHYYKCLCF